MRDLLIIMRAPDSNPRQTAKINFLLRGVPIPTDVIVVTTEEAEKPCDHPDAFIHEAIREGKILCERMA